MAYTDNLKLYKPEYLIDEGSIWAPLVNANFAILDNIFDYMVVDTDGVAVLNGEVVTLII